MFSYIWPCDISKIKLDQNDIKFVLCVSLDLILFWHARISPPKRLLAKICKWQNRFRAGFGVKSQHFRSLVVFFNNSTPSDLKNVFKLWNCINKKRYSKWKFLDQRVCCWWKLKCKQEEEQSGFTYFLTVLHVFSHLFVLKI